MFCIIFQFNSAIQLVLLGSRKLAAFVLATSQFKPKKEANPSYFVDACPLIFKIKITSLYTSIYGSKQCGRKILRQVILGSTGY